MRETIPYPYSRGDRGPTPREIAAVFFRHVRLLKISFLLVFAAGLAYAIISPSYESQMKVLVRRGRIDPAVTPTQTVAPLLQQDTVSEEELNSQAELLRDDDILRQVVQKTGLADQGGLISAVLLEGPEERIAHAVKRLSAKLEVVPARKSQIIAVSYRSSSPRMSSAVLRALADAYLAKQVEIRRPNGQQNFFDQQMKQSRMALDGAQQDLLHFLGDQKIASAPLERDLTLQRLSEAEAADLNLRAAIADSSQRVRTLEEKLHELPERRIVQTRNTDNPQLQEKLKSKLLELELKRTEMLTKFQPSYRLVTEVEEQIAQARAAIQASELKPLRDETTQQDPDYAWANSERIKNLVDLQALQRREAVAQAQVSGYRKASERLAGDVVRQAELERRLKAAEDKYLLYSSKREEARIGDALDQSGILNVTLAEQPRTPALPASPLCLTTGISLAAACFASATSAFVAEYLDPSLKSASDAVKALGVPVLASLPAAHPDGMAGRMA
jgi:uncharacterized protein involved in exopolysaccharide biosynthesis